MVNASSSALSIELILDNVLESIDNPKTLSWCARVNSTWYRRAIPVLWRGSVDRGDDTWKTPDIGVLSQLAQMPDRFRFYMGFVRFLQLSSVPADHPSSLFASSLWSTAKPISLNVDIGSDLMSEENMSSLLQPNLKSIELFGGNYSDGFLTALKTKAPNLINLLVDNSSDELTSQGLLDYLMDMPQLRHLEFVHGFELVVTERLLIHLLGRPNLEHLVLGSVSMLTAYAVSKADEAPATKSLRNLELRAIEGSAARMLLPRMAQLEGFGLDLEDCSLNLSEDIILPLSYCSRLRDITIHLGSSDALGAGDLSALSKGCPELRTLEIEGDPSFASLSALLQPHDIASLATQCLKLETLSIEYPCLVTVSEFVLLGRNCQLLRHLKLNTGLELLELSDVPEGVLFSCLQELELTSFTGGPRGANNSTVRRIEMEIVMAVDEIDEIIQARMPLLNRLIVPQRRPEYTASLMLNTRLENRTSSAQVRSSVRHEILMEVLNGGRW